MSKYVDSYVMPVPKSKVAAYKEFGTKMADLAKKHGALSYVNCVGDDVKPGKSALSSTRSEPRPSGTRSATWIRSIGKSRTSSRKSRREARHARFG